MTLEIDSDHILKRSIYFTYPTSFEIVTVIFNLKTIVQFGILLFEYI